MDTTPKNKKPMTKDDVACLVDLIQSTPILCSKETNAATNKLKEEAWVSVTAAFNAKTGSIPRQRDQLKLKWDNLKKSARKRAQQMRMNALKTGGGKPEFIPPDEILDKVTGLLGSNCTGLDVPFGGDAVGGGDGAFSGLDLDLEIIESMELQKTRPDARPIIPEDIIIIQSPSGDKKRKLEDTYIPKSLYGMPSISNALKRKDNKKMEKQDMGVRERNLAIANYYNKKAAKIDLEMDLLRIEIENRKKGDLWML